MQIGLFCSVCESPFSSRNQPPGNCPDRVLVSTSDSERETCSTILVSREDYITTQERRRPGSENVCIQPARGISLRYASAGAPAAGPIYFLPSSPPSVFSAPCFTALSAPAFLLTSYGDCFTTSFSAPFSGGCCPQYRVHSYKGGWGVFTVKDGSLPKNSGAGCLKCRTWFARQVKTNSTRNPGHAFDTKFLRSTTV